MLNKNSRWMDRIKGVEREYLAMRQAADRLIVEVAHDPDILKRDVKPRDLDIASELLEITYVIRIFAEFEAGLRQFWSTTRKTRPPTEVLIDRIAALRSVAEAVLMKAQEVRDSRNGFIHAREGRIEAIPIADIRSHLCQFFGHLPNEWCAWVGVFQRSRH